MQDDRRFEVILERLLGGAREQFPELDTREGALIYSALAPAAVELSRLYTALEFALEMSYADTASREYLVRRASERGISPLEATPAVIEATVLPEGVQIPLGSRFRAGGMVYALSAWSVEGTPLLTAESPGALGNLSGGSLVPVDVIEELRGASIRALAVPGQDVEETEAFRRRYMGSHRAQGFGGNITAYREKVLTVPGVGGVRVTSTPRGPGTVGVTILAADYEPPSGALLASVQEMLDPKEESGAGRGWAPIGHSVTVAGVETLPVLVTVALVLESGADRGVVEEKAEAAIQAYFLELRAAWDSGGAIVVRLSQVDTRLLDLPGVLDVAEAALNGQRGNLHLGDLQVPVLGGLTLWSA